MVKFELDIVLFCHVYYTAWIPTYAAYVHIQYIG